MQKSHIVVVTGSGMGQQVSSEGVKPISLREADRLDDFFNELIEYYSLPISFHEINADTTYEVVGDEFIIGHYNAIVNLLAVSTSKKELAGSCIPIDLSRAEAVELAESDQLAGVIDSATYSQWLIDYPRAEVALYQRKQYPPLTDIQGVVSSREKSENYTRVIAEPGVTLPEFLARYLAVLNT